MSNIIPTYALRSFHVLQVFLAGFGAYNSYIAIRNLGEYEDSVRKAAKWSNEAQSQLDKTRSTQGAGAVSITLSIATSLTLAIAPSYLPSWVVYSASPILVVGLAGVRQYMKSFWGRTGGVRIPLPTMGDYNEAQRKTGVILDVLEWLSYTWIVSSLGWALVGA